MGSGRHADVAMGSGRRADMAMGCVRIAVMMLSRAHRIGREVGKRG